MYVPNSRGPLIRTLAIGALLVSALAPPVSAQVPTQPPPPATQAVASPRPATYARVHGVVFDSVAQRPLASALVQLVALGDSNRIRSARTDDQGVYAIDSVPMGMYVLGFLHNRLDTLHFESPLRRVEVQLPGDVRVPLAIPSVATLIGLQCGQFPRGQLPTMMMGTVRAALNAQPVRGARVRAQWSEILVGPRGLEKRSPAHYVTTGEQGAFAFCGVPTDVAVIARAFEGTDSSGVVELHAPANGLLFRDLYIGSALRGTARVRGSVRTVAGEPIIGARLVAWATTASATTPSSGQFELGGLPSGTYMVESRALGFTPTRLPVDLNPNVPSTMTIAMTSLPVVTDTVRVRARVNSGAVPLADFERRRKNGDGHFFDEQQLKERGAMYMADIFRTTLGMTIMPGSYGGDRVLMRASGGGGPCVPAVFLNGLSVFTTDGVLDAIVNPQEVRGVEIYSHGSSVPIQFQSRNGCGSIVLWTGARSGQSPL